MRTDSLRVSDEAIDGRPRPDPGRVRRALPARQAEPLRRRQAGAGGPRGDPADRPGARPRDDQGPPLDRPVQALSADLPPVRRQPDDARPSSRSPTSRSRPARGSSRPRARSSSSTATAGSCRRPASRRTQLLPHLAVGQALDLHALDADPALHPAAAAVHRGDADQGAGEGGHRPARAPTRRSSRRSRTAHYVEQKERRFFATDLGMVVTDLLVEHFPKILDLKFTAHMEDELDDIATAKEDMVKVLDEFYHPFQESLKTAETQMERVQVPSSEICHVCGAPMVVKFSKTGQFLGCSKYPECKATRPMDGQPRAAAVETEHTLPQVRQAADAPREQARASSCPARAIPAARSRSTSTPQGNPVPSVVETEHVCEKCGKPMALRQGSRGAFLGCTGYPKCRNTHARRRPGQARRRRSRSRSSARSAAARWASSRAAAAPFLGCLNYPKCRSTAPIPDELKEQLGEQPRRPGRAPAADLKAIEVDETCENCGGPMIVRRGPSRLLPRLRQLPQVQGDPRARRGDAGEDQRRRRGLRCGSGRPGPLAFIPSRARPRRWPFARAAGRARRRGHRRWRRSGSARSRSGYRRSRAGARPPWPRRRPGPGAAPPSPLRTSRSVQAIPRLQPVPSALRIASLAAQRPAKCSIACLRAWQ